MPRYKKSRSAARFGPRYGRKHRQRVADVEEKMRKRHRCPRCTAIAVKRMGTALWRCRRCGVVFAGGAYMPATPLAGSPLRQAQAPEASSKPSP